MFPSSKCTSWFIMAIYLYAYIVEDFPAESLHQSLIIFDECTYYFYFPSQSPFRGERILAVESRGNSSDQILQFNPVL